jgi:hypothetical protein
MKIRLINLGVALSQLLHVVLTLGSGDPKMTTSARLGRQVARGEGWAIVVCRVISTLFQDPRHCLHSYWRDEKRRMCGGDHDE